MFKSQPVCDAEQLGPKLRCITWAILWTFFEGVEYNLLQCRRN
jgi:hypothetical protein